MTRHLKGFSTIYKTTPETVEKSIALLDQMDEKQLRDGTCLCTLMTELKVTPREGMLLISNWYGKRNKPKG